MLSVERIIDAMFDVLNKPAGSYKQIADGVSIRLGEFVPVYKVTNAIYVLRQAPPDLYGWTIMHCKRGRTHPGRLFRVRVDTDGYPIFTEEQAEFFKTGLIGTLSHIHTMAGNMSEQMKIAAVLLPTQSGRNYARHMVTDTKYMSNKAWEFREDCRQAV